MHLISYINKIVLFLSSILLCCNSFAKEDLLSQGRQLQRDGNYDQAIAVFKECLSAPEVSAGINEQQMFVYTEALVQLMNSFQSKGEPEECIAVLNELFDSSDVLQKYCARDFYSVLAYALSRTENMKGAEESMLKVFTLPLEYPTPERFFRDYAYAASVFYSNPEYQKDVVYWCEQALEQVELCDNTSGKQWVTAMLGSVYKRNGQLNKALELFLQSKEVAEIKNDYLGILNSLHVLIDLFLYWDVPEYANLYASEAVRVESNMTMKNPMVSAQTYINKGRALLMLGEADSVNLYMEKARKYCQSLPYNSGMVDVDLLHGIYLTEFGSDSLHLGIQELKNVTLQGTPVNRAKAYHQLAQTYLKCGKEGLADVMLDNMYSLLNQGESPVYIHIDYDPILNHYLKSNNSDKVERYVRLMMREQQILKDKSVNFNLVEAIVEHQTEQKSRELKMAELIQTNQRLYLMICIILSIMAISVIVCILLYQRKQHDIQMQNADRRLASVVQELNQSNAEKDILVREFDELMNDKDHRQELVSLTPSILPKDGESKFRQRFEVLYPLFLPRLRERVPSITRREELLSMLIVLKQDNQEIAELLAIAPRSVLMLRHRFRQKIGMTADKSLEEFIEDTLGL